MKKSNKILAVVLALVMMLTAVPMMTAGATEEHVHAFAVEMIGEGENAEPNTAEPTCTQKGYTVYKCTDEECGLTFTKYTDELGHDFKGEPARHTNASIDVGYHKQYCQRCNNMINWWHDFSIVDAENEANKAATCTETGVKVVKCACGKTKEEVVPALGHTYSAVVVNKDAAGNDAGTHAGVCKVCNTNIPAEAHIWDDGVVTKAPQCDAKGEKKFTCTVCEATRVEEIAPAHTLPAEPVSVDDYTHKYTCAVVGCGHVFTEEELAALEETTAHKYVVVVGEASKCDNTVALTVTCEYCNYKIEAKATEHKFGDIEKYDEVGHKQTCEKCKLVVVVPHAWGEGNVIKEATCKEDGEKTFTCACGEKKTDVIAKTNDHNVTWTVKTAATCGAKGVEEGTCTVCGEKQTREIPMVGEHTWGEWKVTREPSILWKGEETRECSVCGAKETREYVKPENPDEPEYKVGDVNGDKTVGAVDARMILRYVADLIELSEDELARADVDGNGQVQAVDARKILRMLVEQE